MTSTLIAGFGYTGARLRNTLIDRHLDVRTLARSRGADLQIDLDQHLDKRAVPEFDAVVFLAPPAAGDPEPRVSRLLSAMPKQPACFVLVSTSGVYGDCKGALVDETNPLRPKTERAKRRVTQEHTTRELLAAKTRLVILRVAGIYGPDRLPITRLQAGEPVIAAQEAYPGNRIHVDDLVRVIVGALENPIAEGIYNVADGNHISGTEYYQRVAKIAGLPPPREISRAAAEVEFSAMRLSFLAESRRLDTSRLQEHLGDCIAYGDLDAGIKASLASER